MTQTLNAHWLARLLAGTTLEQAAGRIAQSDHARLLAEQAAQQAVDQAAATARQAQASIDQTREALQAQKKESEAMVAELRSRLAQVESELKVRTDIMNLTSIVSEGDKKGDILNVNEKFCEVSKYSREELIGAPHNTTRHPDMPKEVFKQMWSTIGRGQIFRGVVKNRAKDGTPYYVDAVIAPILGDNGKPVKYLGVRYDITESEVERHNAKGILDAIDRSYAYIEFSLDGTVRKANAKFLELMGYREAEVVGKHHRMFVDPAEAASGAYHQFWADLAGGQSRSSDFRRITQDGREVWIRATYSPVNDEMGRAVKIVKIATDVTEEVKANRMLRDAVEQARQVTTAARAGDLAPRITLDGLSGPIAQLCEGVNTLMQTTSVIIDDVARMLSAQAAGDLSQRISRDYEGRFAQLKADANSSSETLAGIIDDMGQVFSGLARGDLSQRIHRDVQGVFDQVKRDANSSIEELTRIIGEVRAASEQLIGAASQVSATAQSLSQAASEQASSVDETTGSIDQMSASISQNSDNAKVTDTMAAKAAQEATEGGDAVAQTVKAMKQIAGQISIVDDIAYQTNLLALNAAIEAARAGEHGKGFAVVAAEVRKLAERSQQAAREIGDLASNSVSTAEHAGKLLEQIVPSIKRTSDLVQEISAASEEQSGSVGRISGAMGQLNKATQQNASAAEELAATSEELTGQAEQLQNVIGFFSTGSAPAQAAPAQEAVPRRRTGTREHRSVASAARVVEANFRPF